MKKVKKFLNGEVKRAIEEGNLQLAVSKMYSLFDLDNTDIINIWYHYFNIGSIIKDIVKFDNLKVVGEIESVNDIEDNKFYSCARYHDEMAVDNLIQRDVQEAFSCICGMV